MITYNSEDDVVTTLVKTAHRDRLGIVSRTRLTTSANTRHIRRLTRNEGMKVNKGWKVQVLIEMRTMIAT